MRKSDSFFRRIHQWVGNRNLMGFLLGLLFIIPAFILMYMGNVLKFDIHGFLILLSMTAFFYGIYLILWSLISALRKGNRIAEFIFGIILFGVGCLILYFTFPQLEGWAENLEGTAIKYGPIIIPGVILIILVPGIGVTIGGYGIYRMIRAFLPEKKRRKKAYYRKRKK